MRQLYFIGRYVFPALIMLIPIVGTVTTCIGQSRFMVNTITLSAIGVIASFYGLHILFFLRQHSQDSHDLAIRASSSRWFGWLYTPMQKSYSYHYWLMLLGGVFFLVLGCLMFVAGITGGRKVG